MRLGVKAALVDGELVDGDVDIEDGVVTRLGIAPAGGAGVAVPGFVDLQINGVAGVDFLTAEPDDYRRAGEALARTGVVAYQPTFVSSAPVAYARPRRRSRASPFPTSSWSATITTIICSLRRCDAVRRVPSRSSSRRSGSGRLCGG